MPWIVIESSFCAPSLFWTRPRTLSISIGGSVFKVFSRRLFKIPDFKFPSLAFVFSSGSTGGPLARRALLYRDPLTRRGSCRYICKKFTQRHPVSPFFSHPGRPVLISPVYRVRFERFLLMKKRKRLHVGFVWRRENGEGPRGSEGEGGDEAHALFFRTKKAVLCTYKKPKFLKRNAQEFWLNKVS